MDNHRYRVEIKDAINNGKGYSVRYSNTLKTDMLYYAVAYPRYVVRLAKPLYEIDGSVRQVRELIILLGFLALGVTGIIIMIISRRVTRPIVETLNFAEQFSRGDYSRRILNYSDDEIGTLQRSLNRLADIIVDKIDNLLLEQNKLEVTIESIHDGIGVVDINKKLVIANGAFADLLEIKNLSAGPLYYEVIRSSSFNSMIEYALSHGEKTSFEEEFVNGTICEVAISPIREEKTIRGILLVLHDVTEKKKIERLKTELVGNLSHELKTPITILRGYIETMKDHLHEQDLCRGFISKSLVNIDRQNSIINDMLKLNRIETSSDFQWEEINIKEIISNCVDLLSAKAIVKKVDLSVDSSGMNESVTGNRFLAEEVFFNIIDNAISYNYEEGSVKVASEKEKGILTVIISDTGIGIPSEAVERIFERFYRVDKSRSRETGGTGLGLSIVKHASELLGWKLKVNSGNRGTTFRINITL